MPEQVCVLFNVVYPRFTGGTPIYVLYKKGYHIIDKLDHPSKELKGLFPISLFTLIHITKQP